MMRRWNIRECSVVLTRIDSVAPIPSNARAIQQPRVNNNSTNKIKPSVQPAKRNIRSKSVFRESSVPPKPAKRPRSQSTECMTPFIELSEF